MVGGREGCGWGEGGLGLGGGRVGVWWSDILYFPTHLLYCQPYCLGHSNGAFPNVFFLKCGDVIESHGKAQ